MLRVRRDGQIIFRRAGRRVNNEMKFMRETSLPRPVDLRGGGVN
jgi:hypothetical protein